MVPLPPSNDPLITRALVAGERAWRQGALKRARQLLTLALRRASATRDRAGVLSARQLLGHVAFEAGELELARAHHRLVLRQSRAFRLPLGVASALHNLGLLAAAQNDQIAAHRLLCAAITRYEAIGHDPGAATARTNLARLQAIWAGYLGEDGERRWPDPRS